MRLVKWIAVTAGVLMAAALVFVLMWLFAPAVGPVSKEALYWSVAGDVGGTSLLGSRGCRLRRGTEWRCAILDGQGSGTADYVVWLDGDCWRARRTSAESFEGQMAERASGCVKFRDQLRLLDRV